VPVHNGAMSPAHRPFNDLPDWPDATRLERVRLFREHLVKRRSIRVFSDAPVPRQILEEAIRCAGSAPNGANKQPWYFAVVESPALKRRIREAAEEEERAFYGGRASQDWLKDLEPFGTDWQKPFLETAPYLIVVFQQNYGLDPDTGARSRHYYIQESVGLAAGFLIAALHQAGLATLTHTPSPMGFLRDILGRPKNEKAIMIVVVGHPAADATVPQIDKKPLDAISGWY